MLTVASLKANPTCKRTSLRVRVMQVMPTVKYLNQQGQTMQRHKCVLADHTGCLRCVNYNSENLEEGKPSCCGITSTLTKCSKSHRKLRCSRKYFVAIKIENSQALTLYMYIPALPPPPFTPQTWFAITKLANNCFIPN